MTTQTPEDLRRTQRRGRIVIVTVIALFLTACVALGALLWQREQEEARLSELTAPGLHSVGVPALPEQIDEVTALDRNRGLVATYADDTGKPVPQLRLLNIRAGSDPDLCGLLASVEPELVDGCTASGDDLSTSADGPETILVAEGALHSSALVVLVAHPADYTDEQLRAFVGTVEMMSLRDLLAQVD